MPNKDRELFARKLCSLYDEFYKEEFDVEQFDKEVMVALLQFVGDFSEFQKCREIIEFGGHAANFDSGSMDYGFKLKGQPHTFLSSILDTLARTPVPDSIEFTDRFPDMTQEEWESVMRLSSTVLAAFNPHKRVR